MSNIGIPSLKSIIAKVFTWFNESNTPEKYEVVSTSYFIQKEDGKHKVKKKKLTRMRVLKRKKEANNGV